MNHTTPFRAFIIPSLLITAIGCGDAGPVSDSLGEDASDLDNVAQGFEDRETDLRESLEHELRLACEASCDNRAECPGSLVPTDCTAACVEARVDSDNECTRAMIDVLNCSSSTACGAAPGELATECRGALDGIRASCDTRELVVVRVGDSDEEGTVELLERIEPEPDETETLEERAGEESDESADLVVLLDIPDVFEIVDSEWFDLPEED